MQFSLSTDDVKTVCSTLYIYVNDRETFKFSIGTPGLLGNVFALSSRYNLRKSWYKTTKVQTTYSSSLVTLCCTFKHIIWHSEGWVLAKTDFWIELETTCGNRSNSLYQCLPGRNSPKLCNSHNYIDLTLRMATDTFRFTNLQSKHSTEAQFFQNKIIDVYRYCNDMSSDWVA